jgi:hypothetical protein
MNITRQQKGQPIPWSFGLDPTSSPASSTPRRAASGLDLGPGPKEGHWCRPWLAVSFVPKGLVPFCVDRRCLPLAVTEVMEAKSGVCLIFVSQGWGSVQEQAGNVLLRMVAPFVAGDGHVPYGYIFHLFTVRCDR